jgi:hypothetical protein
MTFAFNPAADAERRAYFISRMSALTDRPIPIPFGSNILRVSAEVCLEAADDDVVQRTWLFLSALARRLAEQAGRLEADTFLDRCASKFDEIINQFEEEIGNVGTERCGSGVDLLPTEPLNERPSAGGIDADGMFRDPCREAGEGKQGGGIFGAPVDGLHGNSSEWTGLGRVDELSTFGNGAAA